MKYNFYTRYCPHYFNAYEDEDEYDLLALICCGYCGVLHYQFKLSSRTLIVSKCDYLGDE